MAMFAFAFLWLPTALAMQGLRGHSSMNTTSSWVKIYQIINGADRHSYSFPQSTEAVGDINSAVGSSNAKLSDADINSMAMPLDGYSHVYQVYSPNCGQYMYIRTNDPYVDTSRSFGITSENSQIGLGSSYSTASWATMSSYYGIDLFRSSPSIISSGSCCRYYIGYTANDCWAGPIGQRCINGGSSCNGQMKLTDVVMHIYAPATAASATGDPHLQNIHGERFDLMQVGKHVLISIPRGASAEQALLRVQASARRVGGQCEDIYFQELNVTGSWAEAKQTGGYRYSVSQRGVETPEWVSFGNVKLKVVHGHTDGGVKYLNLYLKHLGRAGFPVGGLLGEDDHTIESTPPDACHKRLSLEKKHRSHVMGSVAAASLE